MAKINPPKAATSLQFPNLREYLGKNLLSLNSLFLEFMLLIDCSFLLKGADSGPEKFRVRNGSGKVT